MVINIEKKNILYLSLSPHNCNILHIFLNVFGVGGGRLSNTGACWSLSLRQESNSKSLYVNGVDKYQQYTLEKKVYRTIFLFGVKKTP